MNFLLPLAKSIVGLYFFLYVLVHFLILLTPETARFFVFQNYVHWPKDFTNPTKFGLDNVHNFYLDVSKEARIGIWHFIPQPFDYTHETDSKRNLKEHFDTYLRTYADRPIIIYAHGNDRDRAVEGRVALCKKLNDLGYHVFAIDYRGYGDSTGVPSETGVVEDVIALHNFLKSFQKKARIYMWGHSLGTGVVCHAAKVLSEFKSPPEGVILEAPFRNITQAAREYIISPLLYNNPWIISQSEKAAEHLGIRFSNEENIVKISSKIMIIHAEDDWFVPQDRSRELKKICDEKRPKSYPSVKLVELHGSHGLGHCNIHTHKEMYPIVKSFIETNQQSDAAF